ncbi:MAG: C39 family peptidase [Anaerolineales bacterium]
MLACFSFSTLLTGCSQDIVVNAQESRTPPRPSFTVTPISSIPPAHTPTVSPTSSPSPTMTLTPQPFYPSSHYIRNIQGHRQYFPLGCESSAATDWAQYFGVTINEFEFQFKLPQSDNPDLGFVGGVMGPWGQVPPYSYGVHAAPIAALLRQYGVPARGAKEFSLDQLKEQIAKDQPVIAWVIGNVVGGIPYEYTDKNGNKTIVAAYEHVIIVTGYNEKTIRYINNGAFYEVPVEIFLNSWGVLGNMVVYLEETENP